MTASLEDYGSGGRSAWLDVDWREHLHTVAVDGRSVRYVELGERDSPPLVFVHGLGGRWANWLENLPEFAADHRVLAVDLPGFGDSEMPAEPISIAGYARWLDRFCDTVGVQAACFVGNSMGGFVSAELALRFPERVERLVLVSAAGISSQELRNETGLAILRSANFLIARQARWVADRCETLATRPRLKRMLLWFVARHPERLSAPLIAEQVRGTGKPAFLDALDALTNYPIRDRLSAIRCPTLVVWGEKDLLVPLRDAHEFHRLIGDSRLVVYEDTGHVPQLERPARFNRDLRAFLAEQADEPGERRAAAAAR